MVKICYQLNWHNILLKQYYWVTLLFFQWDIVVQEKLWYHMFEQLLIWAICATHKYFDQFRYNFFNDLNRNLDLVRLSDKFKRKMSKSIKILLLLLILTVSFIILHEIIWENNTNSFKNAELSSKKTAKDLILLLLENPEIAVDTIKKIIDDEISTEAIQVNFIFDIISGSLSDIEKKVILPIEQALSIVTKIVQVLNNIGSLQKNSEVITYLTNTMNVAVSLIDSSISNLQSTAIHLINKGVDVASKNTLALSSSLSFALFMESVNAINCAKKNFPSVLENGVNVSKSLGKCAENSLNRLVHNLKHSGLLARSIHVMTNDLLKNLKTCTDGSLDKCVSNVK